MVTTTRILHFEETSIFHHISSFTLWLFNIAMENRWPIEIDGLPSYKMGGFSMAMLNNQMVHFFYL